MFHRLPLVIVFVVVICILYYQSAIVTTYVINSGSLTNSSLMNKLDTIRSDFTYIYRTSPDQIIDKCKTLMKSNKTLHDINIIALHSGTVLINVYRNKDALITTSKVVTKFDLNQYYEWFKPMFLYHNVSTTSHWSKPYYKSDYGDRAMHIHNTFIIPDARGTGDVIAVVCFTFRYKLRKRTQMLIT